MVPEEEEEEGYVQRKSPALSMWYLHVIDRLRALFRNLEDAKLMSWHASAECIKGDGKLRHPSDGNQWKRFDAKYAKEFGDEARNVRFTQQLPQHLAGHLDRLQPTSLSMPEA